MIRALWLLHNLTLELVQYCLDGKLCLRNEKNAAYIISLSLANFAMAGEHRKRHTMRTHKPQAVSDRLNPLSLGTMSVSGAYIENLV